jgi:3-carboxy-cis,cis-muconate cycloisomerase
VTPFNAIFVPDELAGAVSDRAWVEALLDAERALANAEALAGVIPAHLAGVIAGACRPDLFDPVSLAHEGRSAGNPVEPLVRRLAEVVGAEAAGYVHWGATSQDIRDSAAMLVARRALDLNLAAFEDVLAGCARLADEHRSTVMAGRTLMQQAVPTTFGLKAAGWLVAGIDARRRLRAVRAEGLAAQLGGAAGTLAALGEAGPEVARLYAVELDLVEPVVPWHTNRVRVAELGAALATVAGVLAKVAVDVALLEQSEIGEVSEPAGKGGSSTMPQKRNPVGSALAVASERHVRAAASVLGAALAAEQERALGGWQAEWEALSAALAYTGGTAVAVAEVLDGLRVHPERMRRNLDLTGGAVMAERLSFLLAARMGRPAARAAIGAAAESVRTSGRSLREELEADASIELTAAELERAFDPAGYLGSAETFVDRALALFRSEAGS